MSEIDEAWASLAASTERLYEAVQELSSRVDTTERIQGELADQQIAINEGRATKRRQRWVNGILALSLTVDLFLSIAIVRVWNRTSDEVLCPLYGIFLESSKHPRDELVDTPEKKATFEGYVKTIQHGSEVLGC